MNTAKILYVAIAFFFCQPLLQANAGDRTIDDHMKIAAKQFQSLVEWNDLQIRLGNTDKVNYIFQYDPDGKKYSPESLASPPPDSYIFEQPTGSIPHKEAMDDLLIEYNNFDDPYKYINYIIVINLTAELQSKIRYQATGPDANLPEWYQTYVNSHVKYNDSDHWTDEKSTLVKYFKQNFLFDIFPSDHDVLISFFSIWHDFQPRKLHKKSPGETQHSIQLVDNLGVWFHPIIKDDSSEEFQNKSVRLTSNINQIFATNDNSLALIADCLEEYFNVFYINSTITTVRSDCSPITDRIVYPIARNFFEVNCNSNPDNLNNEYKFTALYFTAKFIEAHEFIYITIHDRDDAAYDLPGLRVYAQTLIDGYFLSGATESFPEYMLHTPLSSVFSDPDVSDLILKFHLYFHPLESLDIPSLKLLIKHAVNLIDEKYDFYNGITDLALRMGRARAIAIPLSFNHVQIEDVVLKADWENLYFISDGAAIELAWDQLTLLFEYVFRNSAYSSVVLTDFVGFLKTEVPDFEKIFMTKCLVADGGGSLFVLTDAKRLALALSNLIVREKYLSKYNVDLAFVQDHHHALNANTENVIPVTFSSSYGEGFQDIHDFKISRETHPADYSNFQYTFSYCGDYEFEDRYIRITNPGDGGAIYQKIKDVRTCQGTMENTSETIDFFDLVHQVHFKSHMGLEDFGWTNLNQAEVTESKPVAGFFLAYQKDRADLDEIYQLMEIAVTVVTIVVPGGQALAAIRAGRVLRAIYFGSVFLLEMTNVTYIKSTAFKEDLGIWCNSFTNNHYSDAELDELVLSIRSSIDVVLLVAAGAEITVDGIIALRRAAKISAISKAIDDAVTAGFVDPVSQEISALRALGADLNRITLKTDDPIFRNILKDEETFFYGIDNIHTLDPPKSVRELVMRGRLDVGNPIPEISDLINTHVGAGNLAAFSADLIKVTPSGRLLNFLAGVEEAEFVARVKAWDKIYPHTNSASIPILTRRVEFDEFLPPWNKRVFNNENGGYSIAHNGHNNVPNDFAMADDVANSGRKVKLRDESTPDPAFGNKTPDAEIDGLVYDFKNFDVLNNVDQKVYNHIISLLSRSNAPGVTFNIKGNGANLVDVNKGIQDVRDLIDNTGNIPTGMAEKVGLIYQDGTVGFLTKDEILNGANF